MFPYPFGPVYGGSVYNPSTGMESRDIRPLSSDDPRYAQRLQGAAGYRPDNRLGVKPQVPPVSDPFRPPTDVPPIADDSGMYVPPIADDSGMYPSPVKPAVMPTPAPQYDFGRPQPRSDISVGGNQGMQQRPARNPFLGYNPFFMSGGFGQQMNPFMGGGGFNPFMGGGYGGGFNPFMGGGGFNPFMGGGFGRQMNPFMGGGFGGGFGGGNMGGGYGNMGGGLGGF